MTKQEQIDKLADRLIDALGREFVDKFYEDDEGNLTRIETYSLYDVAEQLVDAGYVNREDVEKQTRQAKVDVLDEALNKIWNVGNGSDCVKAIKEIKKEYEK